MPCPRCGGRLFRDRWGDPNCFTCGWTFYGPGLTLAQAMAEAELAMAKLDTVCKRRRAIDELSG